MISGILIDIEINVNVLILVHLKLQLLVGITIEEGKIQHWRLYSESLIVESRSHVAGHLCQSRANVNIRELTLQLLNWQLDLEATCGSNCLSIKLYLQHWVAGSIGNWMFSSLGTVICSDTLLQIISSSTQHLA